MLTTRTLLHSTAAVLTALALPLAALAQDFPERAVRLTVANGPGSATDILSRYVAQQLGEKWGKPVVVENKGSAGGVSGVDGAAKAAPDGYNLLVGGDGAITIMPNLQKNLPYNVQTDIVPVAAIGQVEYVLVAHPKTGFHTLPDFVKAAKAKPGAYNYASGGTGSALHLSMEELKQQAGFYATHIPYRGGPLGLQDVVAGQVDVMFIALGPALPQIRAGNLVALATSGDERHPLLPQVPTIGESYKGYRSVTWFGLFAPAKTPPAVLATIAQDATAVVRSPEAQKYLSAQGITPTGVLQAPFQAQVRSEYARYAKLVQAIGLKME